MAQPQNLDAQVGYLTRRFGKALNGKDQKALHALFEPDGVLVPQPGISVKAREQPHGGDGFETLDAETAGLYTSDDLAMLLVEWTIVAKGPGGQRLRLKGRSTDIARRSPGGEWLCIIDNGAGSGPPDAFSLVKEPGNNQDKLVGNLVSRFWKAVGKKDGKTLAALFEPTAILATSPGVTFRGRDLDKRLESLFDASSYISVIRHVYVVGTVALIIEDFSLNGSTFIDSDAKPVKASAAHVARKDGTGHWRYAIANFHGTMPWRESMEVIS